MAAVGLRCPICNRWYRFDPEGASVCKSCGHEATMANPDDDVPRIEPNRKLLNVADVLFFGGLLGLIVGPILSLAIMIVCGVSALAGFLLIQSHPYRCGNCGRNIGRRSKSCRLCGANFGFNVR